MKHYGRQANVVVVFDQTGRVLVLRRSQTDPGNPGYWNFPGGYRDPDDKSAQEGAARELREESGIRLDPEKLNWAFSYRHPGLINVFWTQLPFRPKVRYTDSEHDAHCWVKLWEIPQPSLPHIRHIVEQITGKTWNLAPVDSTPSGGDALYYEPSTSDTSLGGPQMPSLWNKSDYLARWPGYLPYPYAIRRGRRPVPNQQSVDWPQAQFAPLYLPPGSPSFQPYSYNKNDVPLLQQEPAYNNINYGPYRQSGVGPGGDIARLPHGYGASVMNNLSQGVSFTPAERGDYTAVVRDAHTASMTVNTQLPQGHHASRGLGKAKLAKLVRIIKKLSQKRKTRKQRRQMKKAILMYRALKAELGTKTPVDFQAEQTRSKARLRAAFGQRQRNRNRGRTQNKKRQFLLRQVMAARKAGRMPAPSLTAPLTVTKWGMSVSAQPISTGVPLTPVAIAPPSPYEDLTPLETVASDFGDGMAYELAPLTASAPYTEYGDLALENPRHRGRRRRGKKRRRGSRKKLRSLAQNAAGEAMQATPNPGYPEFSALLVEWYGTTLSSSERIKLARVLVKLIDRHGAANLVANTQLTATMLNTLRQFAVAHGYGRANPDYVEFKALLIEWYDTTLTTDERIRLARSLVKLIDRHGAANLVSHTQLTATMLNTLRQFAMAHGYGRANPDYVEFKALLIEWYDTTLTTDERIRLARSLVKLIERYGAANLVSHTQLTATMLNTLRQFAVAHGYGDLALENDGDGDCGCDDEDENTNGPKSPMAVFTMGLIGGALAVAALGRFDRLQG